jgi:hypothetical protein
MVARLNGYRDTLSSLESAWEALPSNGIPGSVYMSVLEEMEICRVHIRALQLSIDRMEVKVSA